MILQNRNQQQIYQDISFINLYFNFIKEKKNLSFNQFLNDYFTNIVLNEQDLTIILCFSKCIEKFLENKLNKNNDIIINILKKNFIKMN